MYGVTVVYLPELVVLLVLIITMVGVTRSVAGAGYTLQAGSLSGQLVRVSFSCGPLSGAPALPLCALRCTPTRFAAFLVAQNGL